MRRYFLSLLFLVSIVAIIPPLFAWMVLDAPTTISPSSTIPPTTSHLSGLGQSCSQKSNCSSGLFCGIDASSNRVCTQGRTGIDKCDTHSLSVSQQCSSGYCDDYRTICSDGASGCYISGNS
ncbi:MAG: hypothetical protein WCK88_03275 [bacterium]